MLTDLCQELKNWFDRDLPKYYGTFTIHDNDIFFVNYNDEEISLSSLGLANKQYYRIIGSVFNDGVQSYTSTALAGLTNERFNGAVWFMAIPPAVIILNNRIDSWLTKFEDASLSPFVSESFGGYSYSKGATSGGASGSNPNTWTSVFRDELNRWRKL